MDGVRYDVTACGKVVKMVGSKKTTLGIYRGSFNLFSAQGVKLDYSGGNKDKCNGECVQCTNSIVCVVSTEQKPSGNLIPGLY